MLRNDVNEFTYLGNSIVRLDGFETNTSSFKFGALVVVVTPKFMSSAPPLPRLMPTPMSRPPPMPSSRPMQRPTPSDPITSLLNNLLRPISSQGFRET